VKLHQLFSLFEVVPQTALDIEVSGVFFDARHVIKDSAFVAISGTKTDGHQYIAQAIENGAIALVVEKSECVPQTFKGFVLTVPNTRQILDILASRFYDYPSQKLFCFGVTGTNGKTSITYLLEHILNANKKTIGVMGTINHHVGEHIWSSEMTTPDPVTLQKRLQEFIQEGAGYCAMEISSHALDQKRADSVHFNTVIFTNLTLDHLDYHQNMDQYFQAKQRLFTDLMWSSLKRPLFAIINIDDEYGRKLKVAEPVVAWTYGQRESDFQFKILKMDYAKTEFELKTPLEKITVSIPMVGLHNVYNTVACLASALSAGVPIEKSVQALQSFSGVPGRLQRVESLCTSAPVEKNIFVDYAHTPDALENTLKALNEIRRQVQSNGKIITVFGCGGDRDKSKRPKMAHIAALNSDFVFVTSDNPRTENPEQILKDIVAGLPQDYKNFSVEVDREKSIAMALQMARVEDVVLIAGKGHEDYQIIGTTKQHFSDFEIAKKYL